MYKCSQIWFSLNEERIKNPTFGIGRVILIDFQLVLFPGLFCQGVTPQMFCALWSCGCKVTSEFLMGDYDIWMPEFSVVCSFPVCKGTEEIVPLNRKSLMVNGELAQPGDRIRSDSNEQGTTKRVLISGKSTRIFTVSDFFRRIYSFPFKATDPCNFLAGLPAR
jgi:hypothetical protein